MRGRPERFEAWIAPMRPRATLPRIAAGTLLTAGLWIVSVAAALSLAEAAGFEEGRGMVVVYLLTFGALIGGLGASMRLFHHLPGARLLGPDERIERGPLLKGILFVALVAGGLSLPMALVEPLARQQPLPLWALWLIPALPALFVQAAAEEIVFRGYLQGMMAARFARPVLFLLPQAILFGLLHWNPAMGANAALMALVAGIMGLALGDVALRTGGLAMPIGLHFANNVFALLIVATPSEISGLALFVSPLDPNDAEAVRAGLIGNLLLILALWGGWRLARRARSG